MSHFLDYRNFTGANPEKFFKSTLAESPRLLLGLNCLEPGQSQAAHTHADQDKFYYVIEGEGEFTVADEKQVAGPGVSVWAPAGAPHGVSNRSSARLVLLVGIAPWK
jgi:quercetin dioxygenase-like cupin family protein